MSGDVALWRLEQIARRLESCKFADKCISCGHAASRHNELAYCQIGECSCETGTSIGSEATFIRRAIDSLAERHSPTRPHDYWLTSSRAELEWGAGEGSAVRRTAGRAGEPWPRASVHPDPWGSPPVRARRRSSATTDLNPGGRGSGGACRGPRCSCGRASSRAP